MIEKKIGFDFVLILFGSVKKFQMPKRRGNILELFHTRKTFLSFFFCKVLVIEKEKEEWAAFWLLDRSWIWPVFPSSSIDQYLSDKQLSRAQAHKTQSDLIVDDDDPGHFFLVFFLLLLFLFLFSTSSS